MAVAGVEAGFGGRGWRPGRNGGAVVAPRGGILGLGRGQRLAVQRGVRGGEPGEERVRSLGVWVGLGSGLGLGLGSGLGLGLGWGLGWGLGLGLANPNPNPNP